MSRQTPFLSLAAAALLTLSLAACGVRGALVPPDTGDVLIETSDSPSHEVPGKSSGDDDARFPPPEAVN